MLFCCIAVKDMETLLSVFYISIIWLKAYDVKKIHGKETISNKNLYGVTKGEYLKCGIKWHVDGKI